MALAALLLHALSQPLAMLSAAPARTWELLYYVLRGLEGCVLFGALLHFARRCLRGWLLLALAAVCVGGAFMELMAGVCGVSAVLYGYGPADLSGFCDRTQGWAAWALLAGAGVLAGVAWRLGHG